MVQRTSTNSMYKRAFETGAARARQEFMSKYASPRDAIMAAEMLGSLIGKGTETAGKASEKLLERATGATDLLGILRDSPRGGLIAGTGLAGAGLAAATLGDLSAHPELLQKVIAPLGMLGGTALAVGSNPGIVGGSLPARLTREIALHQTTPSGVLGSMAAMVGLPAALIGYGRMKERSENSFF